MRCRTCTATSLFCSADVSLTKSCTATNEKLHRNIEKVALQESGAFLPLPCGFQAPTFRPPRLGPADKSWGGAHPGPETRSKCAEAGLDFGDKFGESLGQPGRESGSPNLLECPRTSPEVPQTSPEVFRRLPRKFSHCGT